MTTEDKTMKRNRTDVDPNDVATMSARQINDLQKAVTAEGSAICDAMIAAGRGNEKPTQTRTLTDDLSLRYIANADLQIAINQAKFERMGQRWPGDLPVR